MIIEALDDTNLKDPTAEITKVWDQLMHPVT